MLTLFAMPKPFRGHIGTIQRNAIGSWIRLHQACEVLLFGDEEGTAEVAKEFGLQHFPSVARNEFGTPLLNDVFMKAEEAARHSLVCYVNCDIILGNAFIRAVESVRRWRERFLMVGECWNLDVTQPLAFDREQWAQELESLARLKGKSRGPHAIDYFVFPRGLYEEIPPFALGRVYFDNWLVWKARAVGADVVDATSVVTAIHQNHDYSHLKGGRQDTWKGEEGIRNIELAGGRRHWYFICDATHRLTSKGPKRRWGRYFRVRSRWEIAQARAKSIWIWWGNLFWRLADLTRPIRHPLGLRLTNFERFKSYLTRQ